MSASRLITTTDDNSEGWVMINWTQVSEDAIKYDTDDEETMRAKLEAKRAVRERAKAERAEREAEEKEVCKEEERQEAKHKHKAKAGKGDEASTGGSETGKVKKVVMDPGCTHCAWAKVICEFVIDGNKKHITCKCHWPGDRKDAEASPKAVKGKKRKVEENTEARPSTQKWVRMSMRLTEEAIADRYLGLEDKLKHLIDTAGLIANNLASLFELHKTAVENLGRITDALESILDESYSFRMAVSPSDSGLSKLDSDELCEEAEWLKDHSEDEEEESKGEDESIAKAK
ncbi:hypothetical protein M404DRAFT_30719 [Pisolithus tinctorius Marx 270]|uniref:Uncharacterized protein n=1 Tax=Pisolithus tinctorius Marx 270 TaxID=870435 RepID=A0A0C3NDB8_PISTI|nr:hypothetical protein M404DRAFT_30719 [Pisolithus tinctorius Marx 270]